MSEVETECQNCAISDDDLVGVHRVYLTFSPDADAPVGQPVAVTHHVQDEIEQWCVPCATQYPCEWL